MPHTFPSTAQSASIVGRTPGPQPTPPSARRSVDDADFIGEKRVQGDPHGPGGPPHNFGGIRSFGKKYAALPGSGSAASCPRRSTPPAARPPKRSTPPAAWPAPGRERRSETRRPPPAPKRRDIASPAAA